MAEVILFKDRYMNVINSIEKVKVYTMHFSAIGKFFGMEKMTCK